MYTDNALGLAWRMLFCRAICEWGLETTASRVILVFIGMCWLHTISCKHSIKFIFIISSHSWKTMMHRRILCAVAREALLSDRQLRRFRGRHRLSWYRGRHWLKSCWLKSRQRLRRYSGRDWLVHSRGYSCYFIWRSRGWRQKLCRKLVRLG